MNLTPEQKQIGTDNFNDAVGWSRRDFLKGVAAGGVGLGATYFGYEQLQGSPVKVAWIGTGDEGSVLLNEHPPAYMDITAVADLRPSNRTRAFTGDGNDVRRGLTNILGKSARQDIKVYDSHAALLKAIAGGEVEVEAVVIAVPLNQHAPLAIECLNAGLHVLTEKLMAHDIGQCKAMIRAARQNNKLLAVGHQRHYNVLYDNANSMIRNGLLGDIKHIRAQWHRNNSFHGRDSWRKDIGSDGRAYRADMEALAKAGVDVRQFGFEDFDQLANWRLYNETGGGLMAELGSHQLDAASIFLGKVHPISVTGYGGKNFYGVTWKDQDGNQRGLGPQDKWNDPREIADHVYTIYEFPGPHYDDDQDDIVIVTYSSINTNSFEPYGELVYGSRATLIMEQELQAHLYKERDPNNSKDRESDKSPYDKRLTVVQGTGGPTIETSESLGPSTAAAINVSKMGEKVSRGYTEEMEHFCWAIRNLGPTFYRDGQPIPAGPDTKGLRCPDVQGMGDAIMALTANLAMKYRQRIEFQPEWFDPDHEATPEKDLAKRYGKKA